MDKTKLRAWWFERQGLSGMPGASPAEVLEESGWARSEGGANPYLPESRKPKIQMIRGARPTAGIA